MKQHSGADFVAGGIIMSSNEKTENGKTCFLCHPKEDLSKYYAIRCGPASWKYECDCPVCGHYYVSKSAFDGMQQGKEDSFFEKARAIAAMRKLQGRDNYTLSLGSDYSSIMIGDNNFLDEYPTSFSKKLQKVLWNIGKLTNFDPTKTIDFDGTNIQYLFSGTRREAFNLLDLLFKGHYISNNTNEAFYSQDIFCACDVHLTMAGLAEITKDASNEQCFVAMWFNPHMDNYRKSIKCAISKAGYDPVIADEVLHNDQIMPKVLELIKNSRFVIADLTSPKNDARGGVYYEVGYANGLGSQVILTCEEKCMEDVHFDLKQVMCYEWTNENGVLKHKNQDFEEVITENILRNIGPGPGKNNDHE